MYVETKAVTTRRRRGQNCEGRNSNCLMFKRLATLWLKYLKGRTLSPGNLVHVGITVVRMVKGGLYKTGRVGACWYDCG